MKLKLLILLLFVSAHVASQSLGIKSNLLYDAVATPNLGLEVSSGGHWSFLASGSINPFTFSGNRKWKLWLVETEVRRWLKQPFRGHHFGFRIAGGEYNVSRIPLPFVEDARRYRYEGWGMQAGITYGYAWRLGKHLGVEVSMGLGLNYADYKRFDCPHCGEFRGKETKRFISPTHAGISLVYRIGKEKGARKMATEIHLMDDVKSVSSYSDEKHLAIMGRHRLASCLRPVSRVIESKDTLSVHFDVAEVTLNLAFSGNGWQLNRITEALNTLQQDSANCIEEIEIAGYASPEGDSLLNNRIAYSRARQLIRTIQKRTGLPEKLFRLNVGGADWDGLAKLVEQSDMECRDEVLAIIRTQPAAKRTTLLKKLNGGAAYRVLVRQFYPDLRRACYVRVKYRTTKYQQ